MKTHWDGLKILITDDGCFNGKCQLTSNNGNVLYANSTIANLPALRKNNKELAAKDKKNFGYLMEPTELIINASGLRELFAL